MIRLTLAEAGPTGLCREIPCDTELGEFPTLGTKVKSIILPSYTNGVPYRVFGGRRRKAISTRELSMPPFCVNWTPIIKIKEEL